MGELRAKEVACKPFEQSRLESSLDEIRAMTLQTPKQFQTALRELLAECGVALLVVSQFSGTKAHGATFWLSQEKAVLMLTIRGRWADIFWFSLFHELGHILLHGRRGIFIEDESAGAEQEEQEEEANVFARDLLVPAAAYQRFVKGGNFYQESVAEFARKIGIDAGIVVGRLQHDSHLRPEWGNRLRTRYTWSASKRDES